MKFDITSPVFEDIGTLSLSLVPGSSFGESGFFPFDYTGAKNELLACRQTAWLGVCLTQSPVYDIHGKDVIKFLNRYCVNRDFAATKDKKGKHVLICNEKGQILADGVLLKTGENKFRTYWLAPVIAVLAQASGMDVQGEFIGFCSERTSFDADKVPDVQLFEELKRIAVEFLLDKGLEFP